MTELPRCAECREPIGADEPLIAERLGGSVVRTDVVAGEPGRHEPYGTLMFHRDCFRASLAER